MTERLCPDCYGGHFRPCQLCGDTGRISVTEKLPAMEDLMSGEAEWLREVLTDFKIPFDDHKAGRRNALVEWMQRHNH